MLDAHRDGRLQVTAGIRLLEFSKLVKWNPDSAMFDPRPLEEFEHSWYETIDPVFGRLICWINFSAGAEFLAKGVCLLHGIDIRTADKVPSYPTYDIESWVKQFHGYNKKEIERYNRMDTINYGSLGNLVYTNKDKKPPLELLCKKVSANNDQQEQMLAAYKLLTATIRNRDAHAYVPNVRDGHFLLVPALFTKCFNFLVSWLPDGSAIVNRWRDRDEAQQFIANL